MTDKIKLSDEEKALQDQLASACNQPDNHDLVRALAADPRTNLSAPVGAPNQRNVWEALAFAIAPHPSRLEYLEILLETGKPILPSTPQNAADSINHMAGNRHPHLLNQLLTRLEASNADIAALKAGEQTGNVSKEMAMGLAARSNDLLSMDVLRQHQFAVDAPKERTSSMVDTAHPPIHTAAGGSIGTQGFFKLVEWGANLHAQEPTGENVLFSVFKGSSRKPEHVLPILRRAFVDGVEPCKRRDHGVDRAFNHLLPSALSMRNSAAIEMLIAGGVDPSESLVPLEQAISYYTHANGLDYSAEIAFAENVVKPYTRLPKKLPQDLTGLTRAQLEEKNESNLSLLDHPNTWFRFRSVQKELAKHGEAFTPDELRAGTMQPSNKNFLAAIAAYRPVKEIQEYLEEHDDTIRITDLLDERGDPSDFYATVIDFGQLNDLFSQEIWHDKTPQDLRRAYAVLDDAQKAQIPNYHQLSSALSRGTGRSRG